MRAAWAIVIFRAGPQRPLFQAIILTITYVILALQESYPAKKILILTITVILAQESYPNSRLCSADLSFCSVN